MSAGRNKYLNIKPMEPCALGSNQPLKMSTRILLGVRKGDDLTTFIVRNAEMIQEP
jgi:hypothetical protein